MALLVSSVSPQSSVSCVCVEQKFIVFGTMLKLSHSDVVFCFLQSSFCIRLVVLPRIWQEAFYFTTVYSRKTGNVFLVSDVDVSMGKRNRCSVISHPHICSVHLRETNVFIAETKVFFA